MNATADELDALFAAGLTVSQVAGRLACSERTVRNLTHRLGVAQPTRRAAAAGAALLADRRWLEQAYWDEGCSLNDLAARVHVSVAEVTFALREAGIPVRPPGALVDRRLYDPEWLGTRLADQSTESVAAEIGCSPVTVRKAARRLGVLQPDSRMKYPKINDPAWLGERLARSTPAAIATEIGCSTSAVFEAAVRLGLRVRQGPTTSTLLRDRAWLRRRYVVDGATQAELAAELGCSQATVSRFVHRHGLRSPRRHGATARKAPLAGGTAAELAG